MKYLTHQARKVLAKVSKVRYTEGINKRNRISQMKTFQEIQQSEVIRQVLADSYGGIMYNVANYGKYDSAAVLAAWDSLSPGEQGSAGGILKGAINFLKGN